MNRRIVIADLETGGLQPRPSIMSRKQWDSIWESRRPAPAFRVAMLESDQLVDVGNLGWMYCPGNPIIQIAALACDFDSLDVLEEFEVKLKFRPELATESALEANSYDLRTWTEEAVAYPTGLARFTAFLDQHRTVELRSERTGRPYRVAQMCGHNWSGFDQEFILRSFEDPIWQRFALPGDAPRTAAPKSVFYPGSFHVIDTLAMSRALLIGEPHTPENFRLGDPGGLAEFFDIEVADQHDALGDCHMTRRLLMALREMIQ